MARAGKIKGIRPKMSLRENAAKVIEVRLAEMMSWRRALDDPARVTELHDMRIAAKRLRYALEMFAICYPGSKPVLTALTAIQEDVGTIHDLDVLADILRERLDRLDATLEQSAVEIMSSAEPSKEKMGQVRKMLQAQARDPHRLGLTALIGEKIVERQALWVRFRDTWAPGALDEFAAQVTQMISSDDSQPPVSPELETAVSGGS